ncbi:MULTISPECIES: DivIVA domain-containing protein [Thermoactinomyces]|jgi:DivIVA domain-containing protein|uniref:DivIVA domain-containing protein n=1 Tax=Thermoactinomyces daqus TaxID=1329516 RepID=A0A7W2AJ43_9BACL|nr:MULTISPECIES: DivIVA domain-containing protein [Thermoactinomyces]MBA4543915.1 DivIVA domain-containing protein [Thermoactinomyces daqus]MBH8602990.1 DivIVA domain-containing protein [Thermoactinomyces sp. CICC 10522]MBH8607162.1 DivIVA domain-containing protein [Thermoactinomyces sp. CICC 10521]
MSRLTPMDIFNKDFKHAIRGYDIEEVNEFLDLVIKNYEEVLQENEYLKDQIKKLKKNQGGSGAAANQNDDLMDQILMRLERLEQIVLR